MASTKNGLPISIYNLAGQQVYTGVTKGENTKVDMQGHHGVYLVKANNTSRKVIID
ncbi:MAG: T9SS type A sorting domain-containing protein [Flavobacteriales bacterium]|nr:T9SS type A sorting domain-containing protein [Flavobacteriales bacterium]